MSNQIEQQRKLMINFTAYLEFKLFSLSSFSIPSPSDAVLKHIKNSLTLFPLAGRIQFSSLECGQGCAHCDQCNTLCDFQSQVIKKSKCPCNFHLFTGTLALRALSNCSTNLLQDCYARVESNRSTNQQSQLNSIHLLSQSRCQAM